MTALRILGISGSLRQHSYNTAALHAAQELLPANATLEIFELASIPLYDEDLRELGLPPSVQALRNAIAAADAILICSPEYNYSIPGVLKNAIDWASRPPSQPFDGKPIAIMGASPSGFGTVRAQYHLRQVFIYLNGMLLNKPEVMISAAHQKFDEQGRLTDEGTRSHIQKLLHALIEWAQRLQRT